MFPGSILDLPIRRDLESGIRVDRERARRQLMNVLRDRLRRINGLIQQIFRESFLVQSSLDETAFEDRPDLGCKNKGAVRGYGVIEWFHAKPVAGDE